MASATWQCTPTETLIRLCEEFGSLDPPTLRRLRHDAGVGQRAEQAARSAAKPQWRKQTGKLSLGGVVIRSIRSVTIAASVVRILDAFEEEGWPEHILDPLSPARPRRTAQKADSQQLRETVRTLNRGLTAIRFFADGTGEGVRWEMLNSRAPPAHRP